MGWVRTRVFQGLSVCSMETPQSKIDKQIPQKLREEAEKLWNVFGVSYD